MTMRNVLEQQSKTLGLIDAVGFVGTSATAFLASLDVAKVCTVAVAAVTVFAMLPLGAWRWRAFWRTRHREEVKDDELPGPPCA